MHSRFASSIHSRGWSGGWRGLWAALSLATAARAQAPRAPEAIAAQFCATCHGATLTGAAAPNLLDGFSNYGQDPEQLRRNIAEGWPRTGMPAFGGVLTAAEIEGLVVYLASQREEYRAGRVRRPVPPESLNVVSEKHSFQLQPWIGGLGVPWGLTFLPGGRALVTEREGRLRMCVEGQLVAEPIQGTPEVWARQDGGLLDVTLHPDYARNGWIYLSFSERGPVPDTSMTRIVRGRIREGKWVDEETIFRAAPRFYYPGFVHYGCRLVFGSDGMLYFGVGDRGREQDAQDLSSPCGKIHRLRDDGSVPPNNPFVRTTGALGSIWTLGHRHNQGFAWDRDGNFWATEHGPTGGDELNRIVVGKNYGWPLSSTGTDGGKPYPESNDELVPPAAHWSPAIAPGSLCRYEGREFPGWQGDLLMGCLGGEQLRRIVVRDGRVEHEETLFRGMGRVRQVVLGPDGGLYLVMNNPGRILRLLAGP